MADTFRDGRAPVTMQQVFTSGRSRHWRERNLRLERVRKDCSSHAYSPSIDREFGIAGNHEVPELTVIHRTTKSLPET
jgi:hypothetical protein